MSLLELLAVFQICNIVFIFCTVVIVHWVAWLCEFYKIGAMVVLKHVLYGVHMFADSILHTKNTLFNSLSGQSKAISSIKTAQVRNKL